MKRYMFLPLILILIVLITSIECFAYFDNNIPSGIPSTHQYFVRFMYSGSLESEMYIVSNSKDNIDFIKNSENQTSVQFKSSSGVSYYIYERYQSGNWINSHSNISSTGYPAKTTTITANFTVKNDFNDIIYAYKDVVFITPIDNDNLNQAPDIVFKTTHTGPVDIRVKKATEFDSGGNVASEYSVYNQQFDCVPDTEYIIQSEKIPWSNGHFTIFAYIQEAFMPRVEFDLAQLKNKYIRTDIDNLDKISDYHGIELDSQGYQPYDIYVNNKLIRHVVTDGIVDVYTGKDFNWLIGENNIQIKDSDGNVIHEKFILVFEDTYQDSLYNNPEQKRPLRSDYEDGIMGDLAYSVDSLFYWITLPFVYVANLVSTIAEFIKTTFSWVGDFATQVGSIFNFLPVEIRSLIMMAICIVMLVSIMKFLRG